jgi:Flp pilus assembly protein TadD
LPINKENLGVSGLTGAGGFFHEQVQFGFAPVGKCRLISAAMNRVMPAKPDQIARIRSLCERGLWPDVLAQTRRWQEETPSDAKAFFYQGVALAASGRFVEAESRYRHALMLDPADFKIWNNLATLLFENLKRPSEGEQCLAQALKLDPGNKLGWANLAGMNGRLGRHTKALDYAERALALDPLMVEAQLHRARAAQLLGRPEILRAACEALARMPPEKFRRTR